MSVDLVVASRGLPLLFFLLMAMALGAFPVICDTKRSDFYKLGQMFDSILGKGHVSCVAATPPQAAKELRLLNKLMKSVSRLLDKVLH